MAGKGKKGREGRGRCVKEEKGGEGRGGEGPHQRLFALPKAVVAAPEVAVFVDGALNGRPALAPAWPEAGGSSWGTRWGWRISRSGTAKPAAPAQEEGAVTLSVMTWKDEKKERQDG